MTLIEIDMGSENGENGCEDIRDGGLNNYDYNEAVYINYKYNKLIIQWHHHIHSFFLCQNHHVHSLLITLLNNICLN